MQADLRKYLQFEQLCTSWVDREFQAEPSQELRRLVLRIRLAVKKYWEETGQPLPKYMEWDDPDAPPPKAKAKRGAK